MARVEEKTMAAGDGDTIVYYLPASGWIWEQRLHHLLTSSQPPSVPPTHMLQVDKEPDSSDHTHCKTSPSRAAHYELTRRALTRSVRHLCTRPHFYMIHEQLSHEVLQVIYFYPPELYFIQGAYLKSTWDEETGRFLQHLISYPGTNMPEYRTEQTLIGLSQTAKLRCKRCLLSAKSCFECTTHVSPM